MNCPCPDFDLLKYKGKPYLETPCATCFMTRLTNQTGKHSLLFDTDGALDLSSNFVEQLQYNPLLLQIERLSPLSVKLIQEACLQNFLVVLSNVVLKLTDLSKTYPILYQILHLKMQYPHLSYFLIGRKVNPPCSKQNVLYHLSHAVKLFPDLNKAILTDTRFSAGKNAIRKAADLGNRFKQVLRVRKMLYDESSINSRKNFLQLLKLFNKPYKITAVEDF